MSLPQVVFITGASSGIGCATALEFAKHGAHVAAIARRADRLEQLAAEINALPPGHGEILTVEADVTDATAMQDAVQKTMERFGRLDTLIANAGVGQRGGIVESDWAHLETLLRTNIDGVLHSIRAAIPAMRQTGAGHIILISSVVANMPTPYAATYSASKAFVSNLARSLRLELESDHIWVTDMRVGQTHTEFAEKRLGRPGRVASKLPTMAAEQVAQGIVRASQGRKAAVTLRWIDRAIILGSIFVPGIIGIIARRIYK